LLILASLTVSWLQWWLFRESGSHYHILTKRELTKVSFWYSYPVLSLHTSIQGSMMLWSVAMTLH
jgi:hypothetical protein